MPRTLQQVITELTELTAEDFDDRMSNAKGHELLIELTEELMVMDRPERGGRPLFDVMERMPDADLGLLDHSSIPWKGCAGIMSPN